MIRRFLSAFMLTLAPGWALAEPIVIVASWHNLEAAKHACMRASEADCKRERDPRSLGRSLENAVMNQMAINTRCQGVSAFREDHPEFDGRSNAAELAPQRAKTHWSLFLDYYPGSETHGWTLFPYDAATGWGPFKQRVEGEGTVAQIVDQICTVVRKGGANIR
jgi:hypothetical protein